MTRNQFKEQSLFSEQQLSTLGRTIPRGGARNESVFSKMVRYITRVTTEEKFEMPIVHPVTKLEFSDLRGYSRVNSRSTAMTLLHFYLNDDRLEQTFRYPDRVQERLSRFTASIAPDFSMTQEMPLPLKMFNSYRNKFWAAYFQSRGLTVVPNVSWPYEYKDDYWLTGWPKRSIIAVSSVGISHGDPRVWLAGMERVREELHPLHIIRYGQKVKGEDPQNSTYLANDNNRAAMGWKSTASITLNFDGNGR